MRTAGRMIWSHAQPDGESFEIRTAYEPLKGYREEHEFMVCRVAKDGSRTAVCKVGEDGRPKSWFVSGELQERAAKAIEGLPEALLVELVTES